MTATIATTTFTSTRTTAGRAGHVALWVLQVLLAAAYLLSAYGKLTADPLQLLGFELFGLGAGGMYFVGTAEVLGAIALLIPRLAGVSALALGALMIGAAVLTAVFAGVVFAGVPVAFLVLVAIVAWGRRRSTAELVALVRR